MIVQRRWLRGSEQSVGCSPIGVGEGEKFEVLVPIASDAKSSSNPRFVIPRAERCLIARPEVAQFLLFVELDLDDFRAWFIKLYVHSVPGLEDDPKRHRAVAGRRSDIVCVLKGLSKAEAELQCATIDKGCDVRCFQNTSR